MHHFSACGRDVGSTLNQRNLGRMQGTLIPACLHAHLRDRLIVDVIVNKYRNYLWKERFIETQSESQSY